MGNTVELLYGRTGMRVTLPDDLYAGYRFKPGISISAEGFGGSTLGIDDASTRKLWGAGVRIGVELPSFSGSK